MSDRIILHVDCNCFYASVEMLYHPELVGKPLAVGGDPEERHGIVLTANYIAKRRGVKTGMALWQARQCCPDIVFVPPRMYLYIRFSRMARAIYQEFSDRVESFGLDECWLDMTGVAKDYDAAERIALEQDCLALVTGESIGQVASQTATTASASPLSRKSRATASSGESAERE